MHHIVSLAKGGTHDENNLFALCKSCHSRITVRNGRNTKKAQTEPGRMTGLFFEFVTGFVFPVENISLDEMCQLIL